MTPRSCIIFESQCRRCCFQITYYFLIFSVILLGYFSYGVKQPRSDGCNTNSTELPMHCGYTNSCILSNLICDGFEDCSDGSDESKATCGKELACDGRPKPVCLNGGICRSVVPSATRLAHHVCDCIAPFTGANCSEISTTVSSPTTDSAVVIPSTSTPTSSDTTVGGTPTIVTSKIGTTTQGITSQAISATESTLLPAEYTTQSNINSSPVTNSRTLPHMPQTDGSMSSITSQYPSNTTTSSQTTTASTEVSLETEGKTILPVQPPRKQTTRPAKNVHIATTPKTSSKPNPTTPPSDFRTTVILVVVFALIFLIPVAVFIHCRIKRKPSHANLSQKAKKDDKEMLTPNNKTDLNNKTQELTKPKANHQRNVSISSIKMKENSNLLGNEMPLDVNMNRAQPAPPAIRVTYVSDVNNDPPIGSSSSYTNTDMTDQQYPDTQMWMPGDGPEETPYFVTGNGPLPVSLV